MCHTQQYPYFTSELCCLKCKHDNLSGCIQIFFRAWIIVAHFVPYFAPIREWTRDFLQNKISENSHIHWDENKFHCSIEREWDLFFNREQPEGASSQNSFLLHDLYDRVNELQLFFMDVNPSALLEFVLIVRIILLTVQRETTVWHQPVRSSCFLPRVSSMLHFFFWNGACRAKAFHVFGNWRFLNGRIKNS